ncbi:hypothetical protein QTO34_006769 [Cnephaeus nilssonii]|uniref:Uncharacterized protein n=1 Tax=Cnephaeus nilssonii TaxID=3371016 RepID=A0AA40HL57_CNENI|nr:hypothetical protein QTO34_006769 [Eptesicus nilssonii]
MSERSMIRSEEESVIVNLEQGFGFSRPCYDSGNLSKIIDQEAATWSFCATLNKRQCHFNALLNDTYSS